MSIHTAPNPWENNRSYREEFARVREAGCLRETKIVFIEPPERYPYLREEIIRTPSRDTKPRVARYSEKRIVAYSVLAPDAVREGFGERWDGEADPPSNRLGEYFVRRVFYRMPWDPYEPFRVELGGPMEAVDPQTIQPNVPSLRPGHDLREPGSIGQSRADYWGREAGVYGLRKDYPVWWSQRRTQYERGETAYPVTPK